MGKDLLGALFGNPVRAKVLRVFVLGQGDSFTAQDASRRAGTNPHAAAREIRALERLRIIKRGKAPIRVGARGSRVVARRQRGSAWTLDSENAFARALANFVHATSPLQHKSIIPALMRSGRVMTVILSGALVGDAERPADLIIAGDSLNEARLESAVRALERGFGKELRYAAFSTPEFKYRLTIEDRLIRDTLDYPHLVLLDKTKLL